MRLAVLGMLGLALACGTGAALAGGPPTFNLVYKDHAFQPPDLVIPAGQRVKLIVENRSDMPAEFESFELHREKVVLAHSKITVYVGPLDPGTYHYFNDFNRSENGTLTAKGKAG